MPRMTRRHQRLFGVSTLKQVMCASSWRKTSWREADGAIQDGSVVGGKTSSTSVHPPSRRPIGPVESLGRKKCEAG